MRAGSVPGKISGSNTAHDSFGSGTRYCLGSGTTRLSHSGTDPGIGPRDRAGSGVISTSSSGSRLCSIHCVGAAKVGVSCHQACTRRGLCLSLICAGALSRHRGFVLRGEMKAVFSLEETTVRVCYPVAI